jgi:hypothetical protein
MHLRSRGRLRHSHFNYEAQLQLLQYFGGFGLELVIVLGLVLARV